MGQFHKIIIHNKGISRRAVDKFGIIYNAVGHPCFIDEYGDGCFPFFVYMGKKHIGMGAIYFGNKDNPFAIAARKAQQQAGTTGIQEAITILSEAKLTDETKSKIKAVINLSSNSNYPQLL